MDFISSISYPNEPLISWTFLGHFCHHFWVGATAKQQQTHLKVMRKMVKKCSTDQRFIWKRNTTYEMGTLADLQESVALPIADRLVAGFINRVTFNVLHWMWKINFRKKLSTTEINKCFLARVARDTLLSEIHTHSHIHCADLSLEDATLLKNVLTLLTSLD